jgi:hypothetical protein
MERLFSPCTRLHDLLESQGRLEGFQGDREGLQELNLDVASEELLSAERAFTYADLHAMLGNENTVACLTPHAAVARPDGRALYSNSWLRLRESSRYRLHADGKEINAWARSPEHLLEICDVVLRLLAVSVVYSVILDDWDPRNALINAPTLAYLMDECQSLKVLALRDVVYLDENHFRVLGAYSRPGLDIVLDCWNNCFGRGPRTQSGPDQA